MTGGQLNADVEQYLQAAAMNTPPPLIVSDPLVTGTTPIEQLLRVLGLAANLSDAQDNAESAAEHAKRDAAVTEAAHKFTAQDEAATQELNLVAEQADPVATSAGAPTADQSAAISQQMPQAVSSIAGALSGAIGGMLQPLTQIPQQIAQGAQQAIQTGVGLLQQAAGPAEDASPASISLDEFTGEPADFAGLTDGGALGGEAGSDIVPGIGGGLDAGGFGGALLGGTAPTSFLGPPPIPAASTAPSSSPVAPIIPPGPTPPPPVGTHGMAGMPMVPPGAMGATGGGEKDAKADTRRVSVPAVRNGAPVQGRLTMPPTMPAVTTKIDGTPVVTRRVVVPGSKAGDGESER